jgi:microsomal dipeptidase-like Zn-dependent dipeptidase
MCCQGRPEGYESLLGRALYQGKKLQDWIGRSQGGLMPILSRQDLEELLAARGRGEASIGSLLSLEGAQALEGDLVNLDRLYAQGFRIIGLTHFFDNEFSGSAHGKTKGGLTPLGKALVLAAEEKGMLIDLAHASPKAIDDTLALASKPVIVSHGGARGICDSVRNLSDAQLRAIAAKGGVIGIGLFKFATCRKDIAGTVRSMRYVADQVGIEHVALGSDWDGSKAVIAASGLGLLTEGLLKDGFSQEDIAAILGGNVLRVLRATLP